MFKAILFIIALGAHEPAAVVVLEGMEWPDKAACVAAIDTPEFRTDAMKLVIPFAEKVLPGTAATITASCMAVEEIDKFGTEDGGDKSDSSF